MKYFKESLPQHCTNKTERMLKHFMLYYKKYCRKLSENFHERFMMLSLWKFHEMFWQVCGNIYWNISRNLPVKIIEILHKILQKLFWKVSRNVQISVTNFFNQYFHNLAEIFSERLQEMLRKNSHYHCAEGFWKLSEIFCVWFKQRAQTFHEIFWQV